MWALIEIDDEVKFKLANTEFDTVYNNVIKSFEKELPVLETIIDKKNHVYTWIIENRVGKFYPIQEKWNEFGGADTTVSDTIYSQICEEIFFRYPNVFGSCPFKKDKSKKLHNGFVSWTKDKYEIDRVTGRIRDEMKSSEPCDYLSNVMNRFQLFYSSGFNIFRTTWNEEYIKRDDTKWYLYTLDFKKTINNNDYQVETRIEEECEYGCMYLDIHSKIFEKIQTCVFWILKNSLLTEIIHMCLDYVTIYDSHSTLLDQVYSYSNHPCSIATEKRNSKISNR